MTFDVNSFLILIFFSLFGYLIGSIPFGLILTKLFGLGDIRNIGSGNIGATNVLRTGNKKLAFFTLIMDAGKGAFAIYLGVLLFNFFEISNFANLELLKSMIAILSVIGHCFPIWLKLKGGKGVATGLGAILFLNLTIGIIALLIWIIIAKLFKMSSLSALFTYFMIPILMYYYDKENSFFIASLLITIICWFQHRENIKRLLKGLEPKI
ncbi:glycerol-3-phosphate 1-O-acyltransferase PlsY [Alphaproteobacteria bacterium]|nr:glycerol-3-phosphate 1-O-acyltransferase PlsY [Alphaproteobacteria bacterium]